MKDKKIFIVEDDKKMYVVVKTLWQISMFLLMVICHIIIQVIIYTLFHASSSMSLIQKSKLLSLANSKSSFTHL